MLEGQTGRSARKGLSMLLVLIMLLSLLPAPVFAADGPDLTVAGIHVPEGVKAGQQVSVTAAVSNGGGEAAGQFTAALYINDEDTPYEEETVAPLDSGGTRDVVFTWTPDAEGDYTLRVAADSTNVVSEGDEDNNEFSTNVGVLPGETAGETLPVITAQPQSLAAAAGESASFSNSRR